MPIQENGKANNTMMECTMEVTKEKWKERKKLNNLNFRRTKLRHKKPNQ